MAGKDGESAAEKIEGLAELQNRIMDVEAQLKKAKGADVDTIRAIAKETIKGLEDELATLKLKSALAPDPKKTEDEGLFNFWPFA